MYCTSLLGRWVLFSTGLVTTTAFGSGCDRAREPRAPVTRTHDRSSNVNTTRHPGPLADAVVAALVRRALDQDPGVDGSSLQATVRDGIVELTGTAGDLLTRRRAVLVVQSVRGVRGVSDRVQLQVVERPDDDIVTDVKNALTFDAAADSYEVYPAVSSGHVSVTGKVQSRHEKELVARLVEGVRGVRSVRNHIAVEVPAARGDWEILHDVQSRLRWDALVRDGLIHVTVSGGNVRLVGSVASAAERRRAVRVAWVAGVRHIDDAGLAVTHGIPARSLSSRAPTSPLLDSDVETAIRAALALDPRVSAASIHVHVTDGTATLVGTTPTLRARYAAGALASTTSGVRRVRNALQVQPSVAPPDDVVKRELVSALRFNPITDAYAIDVSIHAGSVTLTGIVKTAYERAEAEGVAARTRGVRRVSNELSVRRTDVAFVNAFYLEPDDPYTETWAFAAKSTTCTDEQLAREIQSRLEWSPFIDADEIGVAVRDGRAVLSGTVWTQRELIVATKKALESGAMIVENRIEVAGR